MNSIKPIKNYVSTLLEPMNIDTANIRPIAVVPKIPPWEHFNASFDIDYLPINKNDNIHLTASIVREHIQSKYSTFLKLYI